VRFLVDENLSPQLCEYLTSAGDDAEHAHQATGPGATDQQILSYARSHAAVIVTADTDFGALLAQAKTAKPSVILVRELLSLPVANRDKLLSANLEQVRDALATGAIQALHTVAIIRMRCHPESRAHETRRTAEGKTHRDIRRSIKRALARRLYRKIEAAARLHDTSVV
jgi:predicted nuclease of predicted toxin-antitoxin system